MRLTAALRFAHLLALVVWVGGVIFFSFVTAPSLFGALPRDMAGRATAAIFPRYYALGGVCGAAAILTLLPIWMTAGGGGRFRGVELLFLVAMLGMTLFAGTAILPEASRLRLSLPALEGTPEHDAAKARFDVLHHRSVLLNGMVLLLGIGAVLIVSLPDPTAGRTIP